MFFNLEAELKRKRVSRKELAQNLGVTIGTVSQKLNGKAPITLTEAKLIKRFLKVDLTLDELFQVDSNVS